MRFATRSLFTLAGLQNQKSAPDRDIAAYNPYWDGHIISLQPFKTPLLEPAHGYKLELIDSKSYHPFWHGPNFITMDIRKTDWNEWIKTNSNFLLYHDIKVSELKKDI